MAIPTSSRLFLALLFLGVALSSSASVFCPVENVDANGSSCNYSVVPILVPIEETMLTPEDFVQGPAEIGKPVKWGRIFTAPRSSSSMELELHANAFNVALNAPVNGTRFWLSPHSWSMERYASSPRGDKGIFRLNFKAELPSGSLGEVEAEYYTDAPQINVTRVSNGTLEVAVSSQTHYENILAYANVPDVSSQENLFALYRTTNGTREKAEIINYSDTNGNGLIDRIYWIIPHLSEQTYEIILISGAEHLDENRTSIEDAYEYVRARDNLSIQIPQTHYLRVVFEKSLDSTKDITIYASSNSSNASVEVYEKNGSALIADFGTISQYGKYQIFLSLLNGTQDTFDLRVGGGTVGFDYVIDPPYNDTVMGLNPNFRWVLDGDFTDEMGNLDGTLGDAPTYVSTIIPHSEHAQCGDFTPNNEMHVADDPLINTGTGYEGEERSISVWFIADEVPTNDGNVIWGEGGGVNSLSVYVYNDSGTAKVYCTAVESTNEDWAEYEISTGTLYHLGCTYDFPNDEINMYLNGTLVDTDDALSIGTSLNAHGANIALGGQDGNTDNHLGTQMTNNFDGRIADFAYWSGGTVLSAQNMSAIYTAGMYGESKVGWNSSSLDMGSSTQGAGSLQASASIISNGTNTNVTVECVLGNCTQITEDWADTTNMGDGQSFIANFTCTDLLAGNFSAIFNVTSQEDATPDQINVSCIIEPATVWWNVSALDLGTTYVSQPVTSSASITSTGNNTNTTISCAQGNCAQITDDWIDSTNLSHTQSFEVNFTCTSPIAGNFSAVFNLTSLEDATPDQINVSCTVEPEPFNWWNDSFSSCRDINITNVGPDALANFQAYINVSYLSQMRPDYADLRFANASCGNGGSELDYEIEYSDANHADVWLEVDSIPLSGARISMYYGNSTAPPAHNPAGVWDSSYTSVYHLNHTSGDAIDTMGNFPATDSIDPDSNLDVQAAVGRGDYFDGDDSLTGNPEWAVDAPFTYEAWIRVDGSSADMTILEDGAKVQGAGLGVDSSGNFVFGGYDASTHYSAVSTTAVDDNAWYYVVGVNDGSYDMLVYVNGVLEANTTGLAGGLDPGANNAAIGYYAGNDPTYPGVGTYFTGYLDEIRISDELRSPGWINETYCLIATPANCIAFGPPITPSSSVSWNVSSLDLGSGNVSGGNLTSSAGILSSGSNNNVSVGCESGNCSIITEDWADTTSMGDGQLFLANFTCPDSLPGNFSAIFNLTSDEDGVPEQINVSCEMLVPANFPPITENITLNSSLGTNTTDENLTLHYDSYDLNGDKIKNITNWYLNSTSIMLLNMPFEGGSNSTYTKDYSNFSSHGIVGNATWNATAGYDGLGAYVFTQSPSSSISMGKKIINTSTSFSAFAWVYPTSDFFGGIISQDNGAGNREWLIGHIAGHVLRITVCNESQACFENDSSSGILPQDAWTHVGMVVDNEQKIAYGYANGVQMLQVSFTGNISTSTTAVTKIGWAYGDAYDFEGRIDDVQIYNRPLSAEQIKALYDNRTDIIVSNETAPYDNWHACIIPNDGMQDGIEACSNSLEVLPEANIPPVTENVTLNSTSGTNTTTENLTLHYDSYDLNGDKIKNITNWYLNSTPIAYLNLPFEGGSNSTYTKDYSNLSNHGAVSNAAWNETAGYDGFGAYDFNGESSYISAPLPQPSEEATLSLWVYSREWNDATAVALLTKRTSTGNGFFLFHYVSPNALTFDWGGSAYRWNTGYTPPSGEWIHLAATRNSTGRALYVNGTLFSSTSDAGASATSASDLFIGRNSLSASYFFNGTIDDVQIYNRSLSAEQILEIYNNRTDIIVSNETSTYDNWYACVTPNDGTIDGNEACSNSLEVLPEANIPPVTENVTLNSTSGTNTTTENLTLHYDSYDLNGDKIKNITNWYLNSTPIAYLNMPFEGGSNSTYSRDYSNYSNDATVSGAAWNATAGYDGFGAYDFNGDNSSISVPVPQPSGNTTLLLHLYVREWNEPTAVSLLSKRTAYSNGYFLFYYVPIGTLHFDWGGSTYRWNTGYTPPSGEWIHLAATRNSTGRALYVNGTLFSSTSDAGADASAAANLAIGAGSYINGYFFNGTIDDVQIYNRSLSAEQIKALYDNRTDIIVSNETSTYDNWYACVTPNDGTIDGNEACSNSLEVLPEANIPPVTENVTLNSTYGTNYTTENLTLHYDSYDLDGDPIKNITNWYLNSTPIMLLNLPFEGGSNSTYTKDYSNFSNHGTLINGSWNESTGYDGFGAYSFAGNGYISCGTQIPDLTEPFTMMGWGRPASIDKFSPVVGFADNLDPDNSERVGIGHDSSGRFKLMTNAETGAYGSSLTAGTWYHFASVFDGTSFTNYLNGQYDYGVTPSGYGWQTSTYCLVGWHSYANTNDNYWNGTIDDVQIYNRSLSAAQILALYNNRTDLIVSQETEINDTWSACVTPNDKIEDGQEACSNSILIIPEPTGINSCREITSPGTYSLTADLTGAGTNVTGISGIIEACIVMRASNVSLNCNGHTITNDGTPDAAGIAINGSAAHLPGDLAILNCPSISSYERGIASESSTQLQISNSTTHNNTHYGIHFSSTNYSNVTGSNSTSNGIDGIRIDSGSAYNTLSGNHVCSNGVDITNASASTTGNENTCDSWNGWGEKGRPGCTYRCTDLWHTIYGSAGYSVMVLSEENMSVFEYNWSGSAHNVYAVNTAKSASLSWSSLLALGRNTSIEPSTSDFTEFDALLGTSSEPDRVEILYSTDGTTPKLTTNRDIFYQDVQYIPIANSTNASTFITGILWDYSSDTDSQFSAVDNETVVFWALINSSEEGSYGTYDYEIRVPDKFATYVPGATTVDIYLELI